MVGVVVVACHGFLVREACCWCSGGRSFLYGSLCRCSGGWILSLWGAMKCAVMSYGMSMGLE